MTTPLLAGDPHDDALRANVRPPGWANPEPTGVYNLVAVGAGAAGLIAAAGAGGLGGRAALVERDLLGGDCLNVGCVPSKTLLRAARAAAEVRRAGEFGVTLPGEPAVDFPAVMERVRRVRAGLSRNDAAARFRDEFGVDVFLGHARFAGPDSLEVGGKTLRFRRAVLATGGRAVVPDVPGLRDVPHYTNETVFALTVLPRRLLVVGGGPIGCELGQAFARLGSRVTLVTDGPHLLPREDADAAAVVDAALRADGVDVRLNSRLTRIEPGSPPLAIVGESVVEFDAVLIAAGRKPTVDGLNLEAAGIGYGPRGVTVDDRLRTTNPRVYAAGDVTGAYPFTHAADAHARLVLRNALFLGRGRASALTIPWCTFTDPELGRVGLSVAEAQERGVAVDAVEHRFADLDRAAADGDTAGFLRVLVRKGTDTIIGATVVGPHAGELVGTLSVAMTHGLGLKAVAGTVLPYPTYTEAVKKAADGFNRRRLTPWVKVALAAWLRWRR